MPQFETRTGNMLHVKTAEATPGDAMLRRLDYLAFWRAF